MKHHELIRLDVRDQGLRIGNDVKHHKLATLDVRDQALPVCNGVKHHKLAVFDDRGTASMNKFASIPRVVQMWRGVL
jgi:hypothetical protein